MFYPKHKIRFSIVELTEKKRFSSSRKNVRINCRHISYLLHTMNEWSEISSHECSMWNFIFTFFRFYTKACCGSRFLLCCCDHKALASQTQLFFLHFIFLSFFALIFSHAFTVHAGRVYINGLWFSSEGWQRSGRTAWNRRHWRTNRSNGTCREFELFPFLACSVVTMLSSKARMTAMKNCKTVESFFQRMENLRKNVEKYVWCVETLNNDFRIANIQS